MEYKRNEKYNRFQSFKVLCYADRLKRIAEGSIPPPVEWVVYPSNLCAYSCRHCIMGQERRDHGVMLSENAMNRIPEDAKRYRINLVMFSGGGDPLTNPWTLSTATRLKGLGVLTGINTQGLLLEDPEPFNFIRFSVDAATPATYQKVHCSSEEAWWKVIQNIKRTVDYKSKGGSVELGLAFLVTPDNWEEAIQFCEWAQQFKPDFIHVRPAFLDADYLDLAGGKKLREEIIPSLQELAQKTEVSYPNVFFRVDKFDGYWTAKQYSKCRATPLIAVTAADGSFLVCQDRGIRPSEINLRWGNYNEQTFSSIWWSEEHKKAIEAIQLETCPRCVENGYNEIIEHCFVKDGLRAAIL